ncbi:MAG: cytochrome-c peroxidase [Deltaproteobacteria bacterium]|nr:cytochrome-c peroxidase [Deltaproteobacteria bacterium]
MKKLFFIPLLILTNAHADVPDSYKAIFAPLSDSAPNKDNPSSPAKIELGKKLYFEKKLSIDQDISCNSCHNLETYGVDNEPTSPGHKGQRGDRNSPTVLNAAFHIAQFWDGRAKDVEEQAIGPILNPVEMAMPAEKEVVQRLEADPEYVKLFKAAFPGEANPLTYINIGNAIGSFERTLITPSRFDDYLKGDDNAITQAEKEGLKTFVESGCITCHSGMVVGGMMYQKLGLVKPYPTEDTGRFKHTNNEADKYFFKVPSLRNVEKTAPYFHDGSIKTLEDAVKTMGEYQLGRNLSDEQVSSIVTFLKSLTAKEVKY